MDADTSAYNLRDYCWPDCLIWLQQVRKSQLKEKMALRSGLLACFFSPAFIWVFPFSFPAPAIIAMVLSVISLFAAEPSRLLVGTLAFAFIPFLLFWLVYFGVYMLALRLRAL
ncbi:hypothetical protein [Pseudoalteromonas sp. R3]|uniref:hypothetical protein n=1 Tax=Pseudoalteromonas sp. R3 TaxID=1709477 RepID=UPI000FDD169C|nr:hypothetical protein [Pseudoalteromonas sp. R3]AZZ98214.1 hypothetical protein ELR70_14480 [Pseudoalteromonas sp. R3]